MDLQLTTQMGRIPPQLPPADRFQAGVLSKVAQMSQRLAEAANQPEVNTAHLLCAVGQCGDDDTRQVLEQNGLSAAHVEAELEHLNASKDPYQVFVGQVSLSEGAQAALGEAVRQAEEHGESQAGFGHILMALLVNGELSILLTRLHEAQDAARRDLQARLERLKKPLPRRGPHQGF